MKLFFLALFTTTSIQAVELQIATFAGGCFWCMERPFEDLDGVHSTVSGYIGGQTKNPTYKQVASGKTGHAEAVEIRFNPKKVSYEKLLEVYWRQIDPTDPDGQFVDQGTPYRPEIFYHTDEQKKLAEKSRVELEKRKLYKKPIVVKITPASSFYRAEEYHQDYYKKNPIRYKYYRYRSGRDQFLEKVWGAKK